MNEQFPNSPFRNEKGQVVDKKIAQRMAETENDFKDRGKPGWHGELAAEKAGAEMYEYQGGVEIDRAEIPKAVMEAFRAHIWKREGIGRGMDTDKEANVMMRFVKQSPTETSTREGYEVYTLEYDFNSGDGFRRSLDLECRLDKDGKVSRSVLETDSNVDQVSTVNYAGRRFRGEDERKMDAL